MSFYEQLVAQTQPLRAQLYQAPVIQDALAGRITRAQYLAFLEQAYHHVRHTTPLLMACGARLDTAHNDLRKAIAHYIEEEIGHEEWILSDIAAAGGDAEAVRRSEPGEAAELMVAYAYDWIARHNPVGFFGMVHVLEGTSVELAIQAAKTLEISLDLPPAAFTYLNSHGSLDQEHVGFFASLVNALECEDDTRAVSHVACRMYKLYGDVFRSLPGGDSSGAGACA